MIIRLSETNDIINIINLWNEAFGDSEKEIRFFLENKYVPENTIILEEDGKIASMLFLLEGKMHINNSEYPSYYLYAACTSKEFRGRGYMSDLLKEANRVAAIRNKDFICLMPGEKSLFDFYEKHGYKTVFNKKLLTLNKEEYNLICDSKTDFNVNFHELRNKAFSKFDFFEWDNPSVKFALDHNEMYMGKSVLSCNGYCLYNESGGVATVKEFAFTEQNFEYGVGLLLSCSNSQSFVITLPSNYSVAYDKCEIVPSAMLYSVSKRAEKAAENLSDAYLGLTLD